MNTTNKKIIMLMWHAGGSHFEVCKNLKKAINNSSLPWDVEIIDIIKDIDPNIDPLYKTFKFSNADLFNFLLKNDMIGAINLHYKLGTILVKRIEKKIMKAIEKFMLEKKPDFVISVVHHFNDFFAIGLSKLKIPFGIIPTEIMDVDKNPLWFTPNSVNYAKFFSLATPEMVEQGKMYGGSKNCILTGGITINPLFYEDKIQKMSKSEACKILKIDQNLFTICLAMGATGGKGILPIIKNLEKTEEKIQIIVCCGKSEKIKRKLDVVKKGFKNVVIPIGFTNQMHMYMKAADLAISKPGPTFTWEALVLGLPILYDTQKIIVWEKAQNDFIVNNEYGLSVKKRSNFAKTINDLVNNNYEVYNELKSNIANFSKQDATRVLIKELQKYL